MADSLVQSVESSYGSTPSATVTQPTSGNLVVVYALHRSDVSTDTFQMNTGTGWTYVEQNYDQANATDRRGHAIAYMIAGGSEGTTWTGQWGSSGASCAFNFLEFSLDNSPTFIEWTDVEGGTDDRDLTTPNSSSLSDTVLKIVFFGIKKNGLAPYADLVFTWPSGFTEAEWWTGGNFELAYGSAWVSEAGGGVNSHTMSYTSTAGAGPESSNTASQGAAIYFQLGSGGGGGVLLLNRNSMSGGMQDL